VRIGVARNDRRTVIPAKDGLRAEFHLAFCVQLKASLSVRNRFAGNDIPRQSRTR
jgi:hypothetical protein